MEKRKHKRFAATAFLNTPVYLDPLPPYFGTSLKGKLIDLSGGGMAILIDEFIPAMARLSLAMTFPDKMKLDSIVEIKRIVPRDNKYLIGIEFLTIPLVMQQKIDAMSSDYVDCESRIREKSAEICRTNCAFYGMCTKTERTVPIVDVDVALSLVFEPLKDTSEIARTPPQ